MIFFNNGPDRLSDDEHYQYLNMKHNFNLTFRYVKYENQIYFKAKPRPESR